MCRALPPTLPSYTSGGWATSYDHWLPEISCCHHLVRPVFRSTAISEAVWGVGPGGQRGEVGRGGGAGPEEHRAGRRVDRDRGPHVAPSGDPALRAPVL